MKFSLIAAVVVLALAQGSFAQDANLESLTQYFEELKTKLTAFVENQDLANQAQTFLEPLASQIQEQIKSAATTMEEQIKPLASNMQTQIQPMIENLQKQMEELLKKQGQAIAN